MVTAPVPPIALESLMNAARIFAATTAESVAQIGDTVTLPQLRILVLASTRPSVNNSDVAQALDVPSRAPAEPVTGSYGPVC
jgi:hypothetical protein